MNASNAERGEEKAEDLGTRLKNLRLERRPELTAADFAGRCGVHPTLLSRIETGKVTPTLPTVQKLARGLDLPLSQVVGE